MKAPGCIVGVLVGVRINVISVAYLERGRDLMSRVQSVRVYKTMRLILYQTVFSEPFFAHLTPNVNLCLRTLTNSQMHIFMLVSCVDESRFVKCRRLSRISSDCIVNK